MKAPAFQFYAQDFLVGTADMTAEEVGILFRQILNSAIQTDRKHLKEYSFIGKLIKGYDKRPPIAMAIRKRVLSVGVCAYCGSSEKLEVDHIIPWSCGGTHDESNLQCLCKKCNRQKSNKI